MQSDHVGFMHNNAFRDGLGRWHFASTTHFLLGDNTPTTLSKHLTFAASGKMQRARYTHKQNGETLTTTLSPIAPDPADPVATSQYMALLDRGRPGRSNQTSSVPVDWAFNLADFVTLETWLATQNPRADQEKVAPSPDFERLRITQRPYRVIEKNPTGYVVENSAPFAANRIQLDHHYRPTQLHMAGIFQMVATDQADAIALNRLRRKTTYQFPLDKRLDQHTSLLSLHLSVDSEGIVALPRNLKLLAGHVGTAGNGEQHVGEELRFPITHPDIQSLSQQAIARGQSEEDIAFLLVELTHKQLQYAEDRPAGSVTAALEKGAGECTDYADLYTTLARAAGLPATTVYGLAYKDSANPAFVFHAWNEVFANGRWIAVDPTWNQTRIDAAHIPLTDAQAANLMLAHNTHGVRFTVLDQAYF